MKARKKVCILYLLGSVVLLMGVALGEGASPNPQKTARILKVTVKEKESGNPIPDVEVIVSESAHSYRDHGSTNRKGVAEFSVGVPEGMIQVDVKNKGNIIGHRECLRGDSPCDIDVDMKPANTRDREGRNHGSQDQDNDHGSDSGTHPKP